MIKGSTIVRTSKPERKEWKQSYSYFTEEDLTPKRGGSNGGAFDQRGTVRSLPAPQFLIFQSSINTKK